MRSRGLRLLLESLRTHPRDVLRSLLRSPLSIAGLTYQANNTAAVGSVPDRENPIRTYFLAHETGRGIWKWDHYFDIYHALFEKFVGKDVGVLEVGIYSGGSLEMYRDYFGPRSRIYGVDIEEACRVYENEYTKVLIGDQGDRAFLRRVAAEVSGLDVVIDDGSHLSEHQIATFEELFPCMRPGGVFICEDVQGVHNRFIDYVHGLSKGLCATLPSPTKASIPTSSHQRWIKSIQIYPYLVAVEKRNAPLQALASEKRGTQWQPFSAKSK